MQKSDKKRLLEKLANLSERDRLRIYKMAAKLRKTALAKNRSHTRQLRKKYNDIHTDKNSETFEKRTGKNPVSLEDWVFELLEKDQVDLFDSLSEQSASTIQTGIIISVKAGGCTVLYQHQRIQCLLRPELAIAQRSDLAVGDMVDFSIANGGEYIVERVHTRKTVLSRPDPHDQRIERIIAANLDIAVIVTSLKAPRFNTSIIDRYLLAIERGGITPLICVNKTDLLENDKDRTVVKAQLVPYEELGLIVLYCSALSGEGIGALREHLSTRLAVLVGHSGVGKTSILNALNPQLNLTVGNLRQKNKKGRHVTVMSTLYELPQDVRIIDTPGVRSFGLWKIKPKELHWYFPEFEPFIIDCKFSDCLHTHEPNCAVKAAVEVGDIQAARYESYCRILLSLSQG